MYLFPLSAIFITPTLYHFAFRSPSFSYSFFVQMLKSCMILILFIGNSTCQFVTSGLWMLCNSFTSIARINPEIIFGTIPIYFGTMPICLKLHRPLCAKQKPRFYRTRFLNSYFLISALLYGLSRLHHMLYQCRHVPHFVTAPC